MQTIRLEIRDDYVDKVLNFLKLLPENIAKVDVVSNNKTVQMLDDELLSRMDDIKNSKVKTISREELFSDI
jgi:chromosome condensin MukBEF MukE localization factor